ncbi:N-acetylmuramoyl-L-alanine amidase [uncultured Clostridium sp.]|jgi:N-acetylmuramoyl-L-alanine amidase|uniref:N-acetylmuramoyl-L-alanine amidase n=1 Tax=uncultured Clostridium sp. TaxID=59620 RepID=UPI00260BBA2D|nr:N-acetylmuramoyl-L-alanine amidase [uncultured Clostridium sp.]
MKKNKFIILVISLSMLCIYLQGVIVMASTFKVCIDPGHQMKGDPKLEAVGPNAMFSKPRVSSGTRGIGTKKWEYEVVLESGLILRDLLEQSYDVVMTREINEVNISNKERAEFANKEKADINIRIHCDSIKDSSKTGALILVPSKENKYTKGIYQNSLKYAKELERSLKDSGVKVNGIFERADITGFNYSKVPTVILEMGFMSNYSEDALLCNRVYQEKLMKAVKIAINEYNSN